MNDITRTNVALQVEVDDAHIAIEFLLDNVNLSKSRLKRLMNAGGVWLHRDDTPRYRIRRAMTDLRAGDVLEIFYDEALLDQPIRPSECLLDAEIYSVWQKPVGVFGEGGNWGDHNSMERQAALHFHKQRPVWMLHPLPAAGRGIMMVTHHKRALAALADLWLPDADAAHGVTSTVRFSVAGDQRAVTALPAIAGMVDLSVTAERFHGHTHTTALRLSGVGMTPTRILQWCEAMELDLACIDDTRSAAALLVEADDDSEDGEHPFDVWPLETLALDFTCPLTGEHHVFKANRQR